MRRFLSFLALTAVTLCGVVPAFAWPSGEDYNVALRRNRTRALKDPTLQTGKLTRSNFDLLQLPGAVATVYQVTDAAGKLWAVRVFTAPPKHDQHAAIANALEKSGLVKDGVFPKMEYQPDGIELDIKGKIASYPVLKMEWVKGVRLEAYVERMLAQKELGKIEKLAQKWRGVHAQLREKGIGHMDLRHDNILVTPEEQLKIIDPDDVVFPGAKPRAHGFGHPQYAHPARSADDTFVDMDNFPSLLIYTSLKAVAADPGMWNDPKIHIKDRVGGGDNLIFQRSDFADPKKSPVFKRLAASPSPEVRALGALIVEVLGKHVSEVPPLEAVFGDKPWVPNGKLPNGSTPSSTVAVIKASALSKPGTARPEKTAAPKVKASGKATPSSGVVEASDEPGPGASAAERTVYRLNKLRSH